MPLAYTGHMYHRLDCPRVAKIVARLEVIDLDDRETGPPVAYAARAVTNRVPCPVCLPHGVKVIAA